MRVIIYAAGVSRRLEAHVGSKLKGLIKLDGKRIIEYQLDWIAKLDISEIIIVIGLEHELYRELIGDSYKGKPVKYVYNPDYKDKGNMMSLWYARDYCNTDILFTTSDLICDYSDISKFISTNASNKILIDSKTQKLFSETDPVKVSILNNKITDINKNTQDLKTIDGVAIGLYQFSRKGIKNIIASIENKIRVGNDNLSLYYAIDNVLDAYTVRPIFADNCKWIDIDTVEDLNLAEQLRFKIK